MRRTGRRGHGDGAQVRYAPVAAVQSAGCSGVVWRCGNLGVVRATRGKRSPGLRSQGGRDLGPVPVFSVIQKKVLTPGDFAGLGTLSHALLAFVHRYNRTALPFNWKFTADDLTAPLRRISQREQSAADQQATLSQAA
jgi:hypothetical protein